MRVRVRASYAVSLQGIIAALLLLAVGASEDDVINDYILSNDTDQVALGAIVEEHVRSKSLHLQRYRLALVLHKVLFVSNCADQIRSRTWRCCTRVHVLPHLSVAQISPY